MFKFKDIKSFEAHISKSIPGYGILCQTFRALAEEWVPRGGTMVDVGCTTNAFLHSLQHADNAEYIGVDTEKHPDLHEPSCKQVSFIQDDAHGYLAAAYCGGDIDVISSIFALQFMGRKAAQGLLREVKAKLSGGGLFLCSEKVFLPNTQIHHTLHRQHQLNKRNDFTDEEILDKERMMQGTMQCFSNEELVDELKKIGEVHCVWQSFAFRGYAVIVN